MALNRSNYGVIPSSATTILAHLFGVIAVILVLVWALHFNGGINLHSNDARAVFNVHPFLMIFGFIFIMGEGMMAYKTVPGEKKVQKKVHLTAHLIALVLGIVGIYAAFKFHDRAGIRDLYSLHSWLGIGTISLFGLQWLFGFVVFWYPGLQRTTREKALPWHVLNGLLIFLLAICTAQTGLVEEAAFSNLVVGTQARLFNFTGIFVILYAIAVSLSILHR